MINLVNEYLGIHENGIWAMSYQKRLLTCTEIKSVSISIIKIN